MKKLLTLLGCILLLSQNAQARHFTIEVNSSWYSTAWKEGNGYTWSTSGIDEEDELEYVKPTFGFAGGVSLWHDLTPWSSLGARYIRGEHLYGYFSWMIGGQRVKPRPMDSWMIAMRLYPQPKEWTYQLKPFFTLGYDQTRVGWDFTTTYIEGYYPTPEQMEEASARITQTSLMVGVGLIGGERNGFHISLEWQSGILLTSNEHPFDLGHLVCTVGF